MPHILAIDQSTSATKALVFDLAGNVIDRQAVPQVSGKRLCRHAQSFARSSFSGHHGIRRSFRGRAFDEFSAMCASAFLTDCSPEI